MADDILGRKVFFLYPHSVIEEELIDTIISNQYEAYFLRDHRKTIPLLKKYPDSLLFINLDDGQKEGEWEAFVRRIMDDPSIQGVGVGILSYNADEALRKKYLMDLGVGLGFIKLNLDVRESTRILLNTLEACEARGRRRYVRAQCGGKDAASFSVEVTGKKYSGDVLDISVVGMAALFDEDADIRMNTILKDIQLRLKGVPVRVSGPVIGKRTQQNGQPVYVLLFDKSNTPETRRKLMRFIHRSLQETIQKEMEGLGRE